jgi:hypothetical protein
MSIKKTIKRSNDLYFEFTEDELARLNVAPGDKFSVEIADNEVVLKKYVPLEIELADFSRETLEWLIAESAEKDISINDVICEVLEASLENYNVKC